MLDYKIDFRSIDYPEWKETYKPIEMTEDTVILLDAIDYHYVWTLCCGDEELYLMNGWHTANADSYLIAEVPFEGEGTIMVHYDVGRNKDV